MAIPAAGSFQRIGFVESLGLNAAPKLATADGKVLAGIAFDAGSKRLRVGLPDESVHEISVRR